PRHNNPQLRETYRVAFDYWQTIQPQLLDAEAQADIPLLLGEQVTRLNDWVTSIQQQAERNSRNLRLVQVTALFLILMLSAVVVYWLNVKVKQQIGRAHV